MADVGIYKVGPIGARTVAHQPCSDISAQD